MRRKVMKKKVISLILIALLMLSITPSPGALSYANDEPFLENSQGSTQTEQTAVEQDPLQKEPQQKLEEAFNEPLTEDQSKEYIRVRVEGFNDTLFNKQILFTKEMINPLEVLKTAVGEDNVEGSESSYGYFITGILGEISSSNSGWSYYIELNDGTIVQPMVAADKFEGLTDDDKLNCHELVFYMTSYSGANILTKIPKITITSSGSEYTVKAVDYKNENAPMRNVNVHISYVGNFKTDDIGEVTFSLNDKGIYNIYVSKDGEYPAIVRKYILLTRNIDDDSVNRLACAVDGLINYYKNDELNTMTVMAYNSAINNGLDKKETYAKSNKDNAEGYAQNIIGLIATGKDPKIYVEQLVNTQNSEGLFSEKPAVQAMAVIALDMAGADYGEVKAVQGLMEMAEDGHYKDVIDNANVMTALSKHKNVDGVNELLATCTQYLKNQQLDGGGFDYYGMGNSPYAVGPVIQSLVANGINPLSDEWTKAGDTLLDTLLACRLDDGTFQSSETYGFGATDAGSTQYAFAALVDLYRGISIYDKYALGKKQEEPKNDDEIINEVIEGLRDYFTSMQERMDSKWNTVPAFYMPLEALALNCTSDDIKSDVEDIAQKFKINETVGTLPYAMNIIGMISSGQNPSKYVSDLVAAQQEDGSFKLGSVEQTEWAVIALDMARAGYDLSKATTYIMNKNENQKSIDLLALALTALAPHKDIEGIQTFIDTKLDYINSNQLESGGFKSIPDSSYSSENSLTLSYVISALVANGIDPLADEAWIKGDKTVLNALLDYKKLNYFIYDKNYGELLYKDEATQQAFIALPDLMHKKSTYQNVQKTISYRGKICDGLFKLRDYLTTTQERTTSTLEKVDVFYTWMEALAINHTGSDIKNDYSDIQAKLQLSTCDDVLSHSENILGIIASGQVLSSLEKDYVQSLIDLQDEQGEFREEGKEANAHKQSMAIIALDLAEAEYDVQKAVSALVNMVQGNNFGDVEQTAFAMIALSKHKDIDGVSNIIQSSIDYLKSKQSDTGGFELTFYGTSYGDTPQYTGLVIQALIANGVNPLSDEWTKAGGNLVDSLLNDQLEDGTFRWSKACGNNVEVTSTSRAFGALADLYTGKSMYHGVEQVLDSSDSVAKTIKQVKSYIQDLGQYNYLQAMALNILGVNTQDIAEKLELREDEQERTHIAWDGPTEAHAKNIMGIIAAGQDPRNYKGKNYVSILENSQNPNGEFNIEGDKQNQLGDQAYSIISLDMADGEYDVQKALDVLIDKYEAEEYPSIYNTSKVITALSAHKQMEGISDKINNCINNLKACQIDSGGFKYSTSGYSSSESSEYDATAIQAIIAAGKNPMDDEFKKNDNTILDAIMVFKTDGHFIYDSQKSSYKEYTDQATGMALAALVDMNKGKSMYHALAIKHEEDEEPKSNEVKIKEAVDAVRSYYLNNSQDFTFRAAIGYNFTSDDLERDLPIIGQRYKVNENPDSASAYVGNIIGLIAAGKDPGNESGHNYVETLVKSQNDAGKFIIGKYDDYSTTIAFSILALDMSKANYNTQKAVEALLSYQNEDGGFGGVDETAMSITALGNHTDIQGVDDAITGGIAYLKANQKDSGGFESWGSENPYSISVAIQGLIAVGENPLSEEWTKNGNTMLDALLAYKVDDHFENKSEWGTEINMATEQAFTALADLYRGKSMYRELSLNINKPHQVKIQEPLSTRLKEYGKLKLTAHAYDEQGEPISGQNLIWESSNKEIAEVDDEGLVMAKKEGTVTITVKAEGYEQIQDTLELIVEPVEFKIDRVDNEEIKNGGEAKIEIRVQNNGNASWPSTLIVVLYDKNTNQMINYSFVKDIFEPEKIRNMGAGFLVPDTGKFIIKSFVWDGFENQNVVLSNPLEIEVQQ
jgi:prenyltransferase beta subunit